MKSFDSGAIFNSECRYIELGKGEELEKEIWNENINNGICVDSRYAEHWMCAFVAVFVASTVYGTRSGF